MSKIRFVFIADDRETAHRVCAWATVFGILPEGVTFESHPRTQGDGFTFLFEVGVLSADLLQKVARSIGTPSALRIASTLTTCGSQGGAS